MLTLHKSDSVFSFRHVPSWLMLCMAAGAVNGIALLACERFVTHVTGTVTRLGVEVAHLNILLDFALVLACFVVGSMLAGLSINGRAYRGRRPYFSLPLWLASSIIGAVACAGHLGWLGVFGGRVDDPLDFVLLCSLSFAMGLQNAAVATSTGMLVRTTHLTGPATDLGLHLADMLTADATQSHIAKCHAALRAAKIFSYAVGAAVSVPLAHRLGFLGLLLPAAMIAVATVLSFAGWPQLARRSAPVAAR